MKADGPTDASEAASTESLDGKAALPIRKRKKADDDEGSESSKVARAEDGSGLKPLKRPPMSKAREIRLEQNRKAARESRRRKKVMIEELQRSVIFFSRANGTLKQQNDELSRILVQAQAQVNAHESGQQQHQQQAQPQDGKNAEQAATQAKAEGEAQAAAQGQQFPFQNLAQQAQAQAVATQAMYESQGFPAAAARTAAQTMTAGAPQPAGAPQAAAPSNGAAPAPANAMPGTPQTGATMQAMANFQQAAAAAVQAAMAMTPGAAAPSTNPQQAYTDTLNAFAMQHAAAAAAGQAPFAVLGMPQMQQQGFVQAVQGTPVGWQQQQPQQAAPAAGQPAPAAQAQPSAGGST